MNILITGAGSVMGQSIYKALAYANLPGKPQVHFANSDEMGAGRYFSDPQLPIVATPIFPLARDPNYVEFVLEYCASHQIQIIYPGTQWELAAIIAVGERLPITATIPNSVAELCLDKNKTPDFLKNNSLRYPATSTLENYFSTACITGEVVAKPATSSASRNIFYASSPTNLKAMLDEANLSYSDFIVQGRLVGKEYTCGCYIDKYNEEIHTICFERTLTVDGATGYGKIVNDSEIDEYVKGVGAALRSLGLQFGHINVQLINDKDGPCLFEINGRLSSTEGPKARFGFNSSAAYFHNIVLGNSFDFKNTATQGQFLRYYDEIYF